MTRNGFLRLAAGSVPLLLAVACGAAQPVAGEPCETANAGACDGDSAMLICRSSTWMALECLGPNACAPNSTGSQVVCDQTLARENDACISNGSGACATDGTAQFACTDGRFKKVSDCVTCTITTTNQVACERPCGPDTCTGCCFNGTCQTGSLNTACGSGGGACEACASPEICGAAQVCGINPDSLWRVQPLSAVITSTNNGADWDGDGSAPDPYISALCPPSSAPVANFTAAVQDTLVPSWTTGGCVTTAGALLAEAWLFAPYDEDLSADDPISETLNYQFTEENFSTGTLTLNGLGGLTSITVQLQPQ